MRILLLNYEFPPLGGGGGIATRNLAEYFVKTGHKVTIITSRGKGLPKYEIIKGVEVHRVYVPFRGERITTPLISMMAYPIIGMLKILQLRKKEKYDIINTHFAIPTGPLGVIAKRILKIKNILSIYGGDIFDPTKKLSPHKNFFLRNLVKVIINNADLLIAESQDIAKKAKEIYKHHKKTIIIPLGFLPPTKKLTTLIKQLPKNEKKIKLLSIGRLIKRKGFDYLIDGVKNINDNVILNIIGDGPEKDRLQEQIHKNRLQNKVFLLGALPEEKKWQYLLNANIYILSSLHEGFGIVLQEAMYASLPIISTNVGGQKDFLRKDNALLIPPKNPQEIEKAIKFLINNPIIMRKMARNNKLKIKKYHISKIAKNYINCYNLTK